MATTPEGKVKDKVKKFLKEHGIWYYVPVSAGYGVHGIPDFVCCADGLFVGIETKAPGKREKKNRGCTALQALRGKEIVEAGGVWCVVDGDEDLEELRRKIYGDFEEV